MAKIGAVLIGLMLLIGGGFATLATTVIAGPAKDGKAADQLDADITLSDLGLLQGAWDGTMTYVDFDPQRLENYLRWKRPSSPMLGSMQSLVDAAKASNINPALIMGIAYAETEYGTAAKSSADVHNAFGYGWNGSTYTSFSSFADSYSAIADALRKEYLDLGYDELMEIAGKWVMGVQSSPEEAKKAAEEKYCVYQNSAGPPWPDRVEMCANEIYRQCGDYYDLITADGLCFPCAGPCTFGDDWGEPRSVGRTHKGCDIMADMGTPAVAICDGTVTAVAEGGNAGKYLQITMHDSPAHFLYMHMSDIVVSVGQTVTAGELVGHVGDTGNARGGPPHIHFEYHPEDGPVNPYPLLKKIYDSRSGGEGQER
jgi:murein DD-endopeptidase MepM/ murein hydrolase activator NlpD